MLVPLLVVVAVPLFLKTSYASRLVVYFFYMAVACTLIPLPTPPIVIGMGEIYSPWIVGLVGAIGNCLAAFIEYHFIKWLCSKTELQQKIQSNQLYVKFSYFFNKSAFLCIIFTGFTPIPFEPFRLAAILISYPMGLYLLATFIGRFSRYCLIAKIGDVYHIPAWILLVGLLLLTIIPIASIFYKQHAAIKLR